MMLDIEKSAKRMAKNETTFYNYDQNDNLIRVQEPKGANFVTTFAHDELNALLIVDEGHDLYKQDELQKNIPTRIQVDPLANNSSIDATSAGQTFYFYDANRNKIAQQDANGNLVTYKYDDLNRLTETFQHFTEGNLSESTIRGLSARGNDFYPVSGGDESTALHWQYEYDLNSNQTRIIDANDQVVDMDFDYLDRLTTTTYSNQTNPTLDFQMQAIEYTYDGNSNMTDVVETKRVDGVNISEVYTYEYDHLDRLTTVTNYDGKTIAYTYDLQGNRLSVTDPDGDPSTAPTVANPNRMPNMQFTTIYEYDDRNRLHVATTNSGDTIYNYYADNLLQSIQYPNGTMADRSMTGAYDKADRQLKIVNHSGNAATPISSYDYTYDDNGNRVSQLEFQRRVNPTDSELTVYEYDGMNRLSRATYGANGSAWRDYLYLRSQW